MQMSNRALDFFAAGAMVFVAPVAAILAKRRGRLPRTRRVLDAAGVSFLHHHYYEPIVLPNQIREDLTTERRLPGIDMNLTGQLDLLRSFDYVEELREIEDLPSSPFTYSFKQPSFGPGDAELLFSMIRKFRPSRIIEVGCGESTKMIQLAIRNNVADDTSYTCEHICVEPYEMPWLESQNLTVVRKPVEQLGSDFFHKLGENDILFIDSSHVIRPQGDVLFLYLKVLPELRPGVLVHSHDILTPRDYFPHWVIDQRLLWNEQYLLEAFLSFNPSFQVICALNWLWHNYRNETDRAFPVLAKVRDDDPGSFWIRRV